MAGALALHFANRSGVVYGQSFARLQHRETGHLAYEDTPFGGCARWRDLGTVPPNKSGHRLVTLLWSSCVAPGVDVGLVSPTCRQGTGAASDQHAVDLPGEVALETADDLSLALAFRGAPRDVLLGATISAHPGHTDHVQRTISLPVGAAVETVAHHLAGGGFDGRDPAHRLAKDASLTNLWGLSPATIKSVAALSVPMPAKETNSGATCATSRPRCASSSAISAESAS